MVNDLNFDEVAQDAENFKAIPRDEQLRQLSYLARQQLHLERQIENLEDALEQTRDELKVVSEGKIPELMNEIGMMEFKLSDGSKVKVSPFYGGRITDNSAYDWLEEHGHADIIKGEIKVQFPKGYDEQTLRRILEFVTAQGLAAVSREEVHPMTLKAWIRTMIENGKEFPRDLFNCFTGFRTTIK